MDKNKTLYFRKTHKLFIHSIVIRGAYHYNYRSSSFANSQDIISTTSIQPNKTIDIVTIDTIGKGNEIQDSIDSQVTLDIHLVHNNIKHLVGRLSFDLQREKILRPNSSQFYKKTIKQGDGLLDGYIHYKFIGLNNNQISQQTYKQSINHKNQIQLQEKSLQISQEYKKLLTIVESKDNIIKDYEQQIHKLMDQTKRLSNIMSLQSRETNKGNPISLSINMRPSNRIQSEHKRLNKENQVLKVRLLKLSETVQRNQKERKKLQDQIENLRYSFEGNQTNGKLINKAQNLWKAGLQNPIEQLKKSSVKNANSGAKQSMVQIRLQDILDSTQFPRKNPKQLQSLRLKNMDFERMDEITVGRDTLIQKLKISIKEIDSLTQQIETMHVYIKKLTDQLKILRKNNSSQGIMSKIEAIRSENQKMIQQLKKQGNISVQEQIFAYRKQNFMIEIQILKKENEEIRTRYDVQQAEFNKKNKENEMKFYISQSKQAELIRQRDYYKYQLDQAKASLQKFINIDISHQNIGTTAQELTKQLTTVLRLKQNLQTNLNNQKAAFSSIREKYEQILHQRKVKNEEFIRLSKMQSGYKILAQKAASYQQQLKRYDKKFNQLKGLVLSIQSTFKNKKKHGSQQQYEQQMLQKLQLFEKTARQADKQYVQSQIELLKQEKAGIIQIYYNQIKREHEKIELDSSIQPQQKKILKVAKEQELAKDKDTKLEAIDRKIAEFQNKRAEIDKSGTKSMTIPQRMATLQKFMRMNTDNPLLSLQSSPYQQNQQPQKMKMKESTDKMKQTQFFKKQQIEQLKQSNKLSSSGLLSGIQQFGAFAQSRMKYMQQWTKINDETKRKLHLALKDNNQLRIKNSVLQGNLEKQKIQFQRQKKNIQFEYREKQRQLQIQKFQKQKDQTIKAKKLQGNQIQIAKLKQKNAQLTQDCRIFQQQLRKLSSQNEQLVQQSIYLQKQIQRYRGEIEQSNRGMDMMLKAIQQIKSSEEAKIKQFQRLMQDRNLMFIKIEKIKDMEISQLKNILQESEIRLEAETYQTIKLKAEIGVVKEEKDILHNEKISLQETLRLEEANYKKDKNDYEERIAFLEDTNQELEKNLIDFAQDYAKMQENLAKSNIQMETLLKQNALFKDLQAKIKQIETSKKSDRQELTYVILDKKQQLRKFETQFVILQQRIKMISQQNQKCKQESNYYQTEFQRIKEKINQKNLQIISITQQKSIVNIEKVRLQKDIEDYQKKIKQINSHMRQIMQQLEMERQYVAELQKNPRLKRSQSRKSANISRNQSLEVTFLEQKPYNTFTQKFQEPIEEVQSIHQVQSLQNIQEVVHPKPQQLQLQLGLVEHNDNKSATSQRSNLTRKSNASKRKEFNFRTPQSYSNDKRQKQLQYLRQINDLQAERDDLLNYLAEMKMEIQALKLSSVKKNSENIKIDDSKVQQKINFLDSRELNNTNQATDKQHSKDIKDLQLNIEQLQRQNNELKNQLNQQKENIEKMIKTFQELQKERDEFLTQMQETKRQQQKQLNYLQKQHEEKMQDMISEVMKKQNVITNIMQEIQTCKEENDHFQQHLNNMEIQLEEKNRIIQELTIKINGLKNQYRKYQEEAQLQILTLREKYDQMVDASGQKIQDIEELVGKYLSLQEKIKQKQEDINQLQASLQQSVKENFRLKQSNQKIEKERQEFAQNRKRQSKRIHQLQIQLLNQNQKLMQGNKSINLTITKSNIKLQAIQIQLGQARNRLEQKQKIILSLKNEIALYNDECMQLKKSNEELDYEIQRITKELKDIMVHYQLQFQSLCKNKNNMLQSASQYQNIIKEKEHKLTIVRAEVRQNQRQRIEAQNQLKDVKEQFQRYKNIKNRQWSQKCTEFQFKNNQFQILRSNHQKLLEENLALQNQIQEQRKKYKDLYSQYRYKMSNYEESLEQISKELILLSDRPSKQTWQQTVFQNQLYRNRIEQLQQQKNKKVKPQDDLVTIQFRKYKAKSEIVIRNLQLEMEGYSNKINELQQGNYYLKKENQNLRNQMIKISEDKYDLEEDIENLKEDIKELQGQVEFYKEKRRKEFTNLLNDTHG